MANPGKAPVETAIESHAKAAPESFSPVIVQDLYSNFATFKGTDKQAGNADIIPSFGNLTITDNNDKNSHSPTQTEKPITNQDPSDFAVKTSDASLPPMTLADYKNSAERLFATQQHNGTLSTGALANDIENTHITGDESKTLAVLYETKASERRPGDTHKISNPGRTELRHGGANPDVLTAEEINEIPTSVSDEALKVGLMDYVNNPVHQASLDPNHVGRVAPDELTTAKGYRPIASVHYQEVINDYLSENPNAIDAAAIKRDGLTPSELNQADQMQHVRSRNADFLQSNLNINNERSNELGNNRLYSDSTDPLKSITMDAVKQGFSGDCYFESSLAAVAKIEPQTIRDSITANKNGTFTVKFKGDQDHPVTVEPPTEAELELFNHDSKGGVWASVMEKAFAYHQVLFGDRTKTTNETDTEAIGGGSAADALNLLTGKSFDNKYIDAKRQSDPEYNYTEKSNKMLSQLAQAASQGEYAVIGTGDSAQNQTENGLFREHDYTVTNFTPGANGGTFELRNPYGDSNGRDHDYFPISGDDLAKSLQNIFVEKTN